MIKENIVYGSFAHSRIKLLWKVYILRYFGVAWCRKELYCNLYVYKYSKVYLIGLANNSYMRAQIL